MCGNLATFGPDSGGEMEPPVFVVGCPRSGTTWLGHLLMSSGSFAQYRAETHFYDLFLPRFGSPKNPAVRERLADAWLGSTYHLRTGLSAEDLRPRLIDRGNSAGAFLRTIMETMAMAQGRSAWAETTPAHALFMEQIAVDLPDARFLHVIRDGRDVAVSLAPRDWIRPLPWDSGRETVVASWVWERFVRRARDAGARLGERYMEIRYERMVEDLPGELRRLEQSLGVSLDPKRIERDAIGSARTPNTSFAGRGGSFSPIGRWRSEGGSDDIANIEASVGSTLRDLGYETATGESPTMRHLKLRKRALQVSLELKRRAKTETPLGRLFVDPATAAPPADPPSD